jgi:hypothetical protein
MHKHRIVPLHIHIHISTRRYHRVKSSRGLANSVSIQLGKKSRSTLGPLGIGSTYKQIRNHILRSHRFLGTMLELSWAMNVTPSIDCGPSCTPRSFSERMCSTTYLASNRLDCRREVLPHPEIGSESKQHVNTQTLE